MTSRLYTSTTKSSGVATEATLRNVKNLLSGTINVSIPTTNPLEVNLNINDLPVETNIGIADDQTQRVVIATDQPNINTNIDNVDLGSGNTTVSTLRTVIASDQPSISTTPAVSYNTGVPDATTQRIAIADNQVVNAIPEVTFNSGVVDAQTQRVVVASDQILTSNLNNVSRDYDEPDVNTIRVVECKNQLYDESNNKPIQLKKYRGAESSHRHYTFSVFDPPAAATEKYIFQEFRQRVSVNTPPNFPHVNGAETTYLPGVTGDSVSVVSTSAADTNTTGTGAWQVLLQYYPDGIATTLSTAFVALNGLTPVALPGTFFRLSNMFCVLTGTTQGNVGHIRIVETGTQNYYPGSIPPATNLWQSGFLYIPADPTLAPIAGVKTRGMWISDYLNLYLDNFGADPLVLESWRKNSTSNTWYMGNRIYNRHSNDVSANVENILIPTNAGPTDILFTYVKESGNGVANLGASIGFHYE